MVMFHFAISARNFPIFGIQYLDPNGPMAQAQPAGCAMPRSVFGDDGTIIFGDLYNTLW